MVMMEEMVSMINNKYKRLIPLIISLMLALPSSATSTFYQNCNLKANVKLHYVSSSWGSPVNNLDNQTIDMYFDAESERAILTSPYMSNASSRTATGYLGNGMSYKLPFGGRIEVTQNHYNGQYNDRNATAYYDAEVVSIDTVLLNRTQNSDKYITYIGIALFAFAAISLIRILAK